MSYKIESHEDGLSIYFSDKVTIEILETCAQEIMSDIRFPNYSYLIYSLLNSDASSLELDEVHEICVRSVTRSYDHKDLRLAIVTIDPELFVLAQSYEKLGSQLGCSWKIEIFDTIKAAEDWCGRGCKG